MKIPRKIIEAPNIIINLIPIPDKFMICIYNPYFSAEISRFTDAKITKMAPETISIELFEACRPLTCFMIVVRGDISNKPLAMITRDLFKRYAKTSIIASDDSKIFILP